MILGYRKEIRGNMLNIMSSSLTVFYIWLQFIDEELADNT